MYFNNHNNLFKDVSQLMLFQKKKRGRKKKLFPNRYDRLFSSENWTFSEFEISLTRNSFLILSKLIFERLYLANSTIQYLKIKLLFLMRIKQRIFTVSISMHSSTNRNLSHPNFYHIGFNFYDIPSHSPSISLEQRSVR